LFGPSLFAGEYEEEENVENEGAEAAEDATPVPDQSANAKTQITVQIVPESNPPITEIVNDENDVDEVTSSLSGGEDMTSPRNDILSDIQSPRSPQDANNLNSPSSPQIDVSICIFLSFF
jgi:hypothetical protein